MEDEQFDFLRVDGKPIFQQHPVPLQSPLMGVPYSGQYEGKLLWMHHTHDSSLWPPQGIIYRQAVEQAQGDAGLERFCLQWTENAEHIPPMFAPSAPERNSSTWLVNYQPIIEQGLVDLQDWVENGNKPTPTTYEYHNGRISLAKSATERGGIQPVVSATANGGVRAEVSPGQEVQLAVTAEVPAGAGSIIAVEWDFDGSGTFPFSHKVAGGDTEIELSTTTTYPAPGTYYASVRVVSHREGDVNAMSRRVENLASARVVVS
jgi:hypothetical protein